MLLYIASTRFPRFSKAANAARAISEATSAYSIALAPRSQRISLVSLRIATPQGEQAARRIADSGRHSPRRRPAKSLLEMVNREANRCSRQAEIKRENLLLLPRACHGPLGLPPPSI